MSNKTADRWIRGQSQSQQKVAFIDFNSIELIRGEIDVEGTATIETAVKHLRAKGIKRLGKEDTPSSKTMKRNHRIVRWVYANSADRLNVKWPLAWYNRARIEGKTLNEFYADPEAFKPSIAGKKGGKGVENSLPEDADSYAKSLVTGLLGLAKRAEAEREDLMREGEYEAAERKNQAAKKWMVAHVSAKEAIHLDTE